MINTKPLILIVDDSPLNIKVLKSVLKQNGYKVSFATSGIEALQYLKEKTPDLILLDIQMSGMDGYEVCTLLKKNDVTKDIPVIFLTANTKTSYLLKGFELGAVDYITKPFNFLELTARVATHIELKRAKENLEEEKTKIETLNTILQNKNSELIEANIEIKKERNRSDELLLNILPYETAKELKDTGKSLPQKFEMVTVLFTDFKGFTQVSEKMTPEHLVGELHLIFSEFDKIISRYPIEKIKTIGDSYMCAGGLPTPNFTNSMDVVLAALEMKEFIENRTTKFKNNSDIPNWQIRIGVHTGPVISGVVGTKKFTYDIWGDTVNIASRMESSGEENMVNISNTTFKLIKNKLVENKISVTYRGEIAAKNKGKIKMYFVYKD
ncbi:MAG: response regulator [Bacteroidia bacterium]|nr:response regulator [Bacteroidia bacterium]